MDCVLCLKKLLKNRCNFATKEKSPLKDFLKRKSASKKNIFRWKRASAENGYRWIRPGFGENALRVELGI